MSGFAPFAYRPGGTALHRLGAGWKLLFLLALSIGVFAFGLPACAAFALLLAAGALYTGQRPWALLAGSRGLVVMLACVAAFRALDFSGPGRFHLALNAAGAAAGFGFAAGILTAYAAGALLFSVTTTAQIMAALERLHPALALGTALMLGFIPRFFEVWDERKTAFRARGGRAGPRELFFLVPAALERLIEEAAETAQALEARGTVVTPAEPARKSRRRPS